MDIRLIGSESCQVCLNLEKKLKEVAEDLGVEIHINKVSDFDEIATYGIFAIPALEINGEVKVSGRSPRKKDLYKWLSEGLD